MLCRTSPGPSAARTLANATMDPADVDCPYCLTGLLMLFVRAWLRSGAEKQTGQTRESAP